MKTISPNSSSNYNQSNNSQEKLVNLNSVDLLGVTKDSDNLPPFPLQIVSIPLTERTRANRGCEIVHYGSRFKLTGQYSYKEAKLILEATRYWEFELDSRGRPKCADRLVKLCESLCDRPRQEVKHA